MNEIEQKKHAINKAMRITSFMVDILKKPAHEKNPPDYEFEAIVEISRLLYLDRVHQLMKEGSDRTIQKTLLDKMDKFWNMLRPEALRVFTLKAKQLIEALSAKKLESLNAEELAAVKETLEEEPFEELKSFLFDTIGKLTLKDIKSVSLKPSYNTANAAIHKTLSDKLQIMKKNQLNYKQVLNAILKDYPSISEKKLEQTAKDHVKDGLFKDVYSLSLEIMALYKNSNFQDIKRSITKGRKYADHATDALPPEEKKELMKRVTVKAPKGKPV